MLIVVATHGRPERLSALLMALRPQVEGKAHRRMVLVNDGTHDARYGAVVRPHLDWLTYRVLEDSVGPGPARQHGCTGVSEDAIVFTDDDCVPPP